MERQLVRIPGADLEPDRFVSLIGVYSHQSASPLLGSISAYHNYLWLLMPGTGFLYECAVHTRLTYQSDMQVCFVREPLPVAEWPALGVSREATLSYSAMGLTDACFSPVGRRPLADELRGMGARSARVQVFGSVTASGSGLHDLHMSSGEPTHVLRPNRPGQDGAIAFYYEAAPDLPEHRIWCLLKFEVQHIADSPAA